MANFELELRTRIHFGAGVLEGLGKRTAEFGNKVLLVYGQDGLKRNGLRERVLSSLGAAGVSVVEHGGVVPNPVLSHAEAGVALGKREKVSAVLAVGGGSVIDAAKGIALGCAHEEPLWDFYTRKVAVRTALPIIAVQTLPATSSEMNAASVLTNEATKEKYSARSPHLYPRSAFLDPELTLTVPIGYTAFACTDILAHMMEGYLTTTADWCPVQDGLAEGLCRSVIQSMERLLTDPKDYNARSALMWAGALAWSGLVNAGLDGAQIPNHMLEHPLSAHFNLTHGAGLSILIPAWMEYKKDSIGPRIVRFGERILDLGPRLAGLTPTAQADLVIAELKAWYRKIGTPVSLAEAGILNADLEPLADQAMRLAGMWGIKGYTREDAIRIYRMCG